MLTIRKSFSHFGAWEIVDHEGNVGAVCGTRESAEAALRLFDDEPTPITLDGIGVSNESAT
jgi:hypothetical protein